MPTTANKKVTLDPPTKLSKSLVKSYMQAIKRGDAEAFTVVSPGMWTVVLGMDLDYAAGVYYYKISILDKDGKHVGTDAGTSQSEILYFVNDKAKLVNAKPEADRVTVVKDLPKALNLLQPLFDGQTDTAFDARQGTCTIKVASYDTSVQFDLPYTGAPLQFYYRGSSLGGATTFTQNADGMIGVNALAFKTFMPVAPSTEITRKVDGATPLRIPLKRLEAMFAAVKPAISTDAGRRNLMSIVLSGGKVGATDGHRLMEAKDDIVPDTVNPITIPTSVLELAKKLKSEVRVGASASDRNYFQVGPYAILSTLRMPDFSALKQDTDWADYAAEISVTQYITAVKKLLAAVKASSAANPPGSAHHIFDDRGLTLQSAGDAQVPYVSERIRATKIGGKSNAVSDGVTINTALLLNMLKPKDRTFEMYLFRDKTGPVYIKQGDAEMIIMPMRAANLPATPFAPEPVFEPTYFAEFNVSLQTNLVQMLGYSDVTKNIIIEINGTLARFHCGFSEHCVTFSLPFVCNYNVVLSVDSADMVNAARDGNNTLAIDGDRVYLNAIDLRSLRGTEVTTFDSNAKGAKLAPIDAATLTDMIRGATPAQSDLMVSKLGYLVMMESGTSIALVPYPKNPMSFWLEIKVVRYALALAKYAGFAELQVRYGANNCRLSFGSWLVWSYAGSESYSDTRRDVDIVNNFIDSTGKMDVATQFNVDMAAFRKKLTPFIKSASRAVYLLVGKATLTMHSLEVDDNKPVIIGINVDYAAQDAKITKVNTRYLLSGLPTKGTMTIGLNPGEKTMIAVSVGDVTKMVMSMALSAAADIDPVDILPTVSEVIGFLARNIDSFIPEQPNGKQRR